MLAFRQTVEIIVRRTILGCDVVTPAITTQLIHGLHAGSTLINNLHKVIVTIGLDGDAYLDAVAYMKAGVYITEQNLTLHLNTTALCLDLTGLLHKLHIDSTPRRTLGSLLGSKGLFIITVHCTLHIAYTGCSLRGLYDLSVNLEGS